MAGFDVALMRLHNQRIALTQSEGPADVVKWLGAVQAQDYLGALWAVGLRMKNALEADIEKALADKSILRTWPMRGTLHFVPAADARWMLKLLTPRIVQGSARRMYQQLELDEATFTRSKKLLIKSLQGGRQLSRQALYRALETAGISTAANRGLHILSRLAQDGLICFGARAGKQQTFALLEEWAPSATALARDEALAELANRYFTSHGPATLQDFAWWTGLRIADATAALGMIQSQFIQENIDGKSYIFSPSMPAVKNRTPVVHLLPAFDEYTVAYKDRGAILNLANSNQWRSRYGILSPTIIVDGQVVGNWKRSFLKESIAITVDLFAEVTQRKTRAIVAAAIRYGTFLGASVVLNHSLPTPRASATRFI
jgi:hypothetical protein